MTNRRLSIALQMNPLASLNVAGDSTLALADNALARGFDVYHYQPDTLSLQGDVKAPEVQARLRPLTQTDGVFHQGDAQQRPLASMDVVLMRQDPPFDLHYISATYILDYLQHTTKVRVINDPTAVRSFPEKYIPFLFPELTPPTLLSRDPATIEAFRAKHGSIVMKVMNGKAGEGIFLVHPDDANYASLIETLLATCATPLIIQKYLPAIRQEGDKRLLVIDGTCVAAFRRMPADKDMRANLRCGGKAVACPISTRDTHICQTLRPFLQQHGLFFVGIDVIGDTLTEVNTTSPTGLRECHRLSNIDGAALFWDAVVRGSS
ncbi:MAG: glutathione synthase [Alphaproteobacteria bacterium GM202ARS2]|nr:glutathione synthase [Alphaproteobacteria bacterium GM202ARS2]